jgi:hypothetical protein
MKYSIQDMKEEFDVEEIPGWCASSKVSGVSDKHVPYLSYRTFMAFLQERDKDASVFTISVNEKEVALIEFLTKNKWIQGPWFRNWGHKGRKTCMFFKQVSKASFIKAGGRPFD